ncbi:peptidase [Parasaccharibacter sp. TMW2.1882]|uniref:LON peptidase substrate-binding domain-containing protein n=1 Tax=unclassified Parasaccharibacter TaxID=2626400 RepID=UPI001328F357|nr:MULTISPECIES: LON peptidase substrate-binding domain-containing protein [unclassified Parasaccharibacter]MCK8637595.1 peptidase [Parasaccharibacter sp. TMW2.1885]MCL1497586.1 peptidase [Parasaccharibacter sp. TMW2.1882]MUH03436.1 peptidase [Bombella sp. ESL0387]
MPDAHHPAHDTSCGSRRRIPVLTDMTLADLPPRIGLLPLGSTILLPQGQLPLTIFEPRYLTLLEDCLAQHRLIGIIQPSETARYGDMAPPLEHVGTIGRVTSFMEQESGQFFITLTGVCRFRLLQDRLTDRGWREGRINAMPFSHDLLENPSLNLDREDLSIVLKNYGERHAMAINWENLKKLDDNTLLTMLPMLLPFSAGVKQKLLECPDTTERASHLLDELSR